MHDPTTQVPENSQGNDLQSATAVTAAANQPDKPGDSGKPIGDQGDGDQATRSA